jgi:translocation and assembly module TamB
MSDPIQPPIPPDELNPVPEQNPETPKPRKKRRLLWCAAAAALLLAIAAASLAAWMNSDQFAQIVRRRLETELANATGGRVEIGAFQWSLRHLEADATNVVLHGDEAASEAPYLRIARLHVGVSVLGLLSPQILLRQLIVEQPQMHLIVYPDQTTNQPHPRTPAKAGKSGLDTFFDLKAGRVAVEQGMIDFDNRAEAFDSLNRYLPLDFEANDFSVLLQYAAAKGGAPESYHIEAGVADLNLARGKQHTAAQVQGQFLATADLTRNALFLRSLRVTAHSRGAKDRTLDISGSLTNFAHPRWQAKLTGELDLHLLDPTLGYPNSPEGIAHLDLTASGDREKFQVDGPLHVEHASYIDPSVTARDIDLTTNVHADNSELHAAQVVARLRQGGQITGDVLLTHWLPVPPAPPKAPEKPQQKHLDLFSRFRHTPPVPPAPPPAKPHSHDVLVKAPPPHIPVVGKVTAVFHGVALDTVLDIVSRPPYMRLGIGAALNGQAEANWTNGDRNTLAVHAALQVSAPIQTPSGETGANGVIDAVYTQRDSGVEVKTLNLTMPASRLDAHGHIGAFPLTSPTSLTVDVDSHDLSEFDAVLRDLGLAREGKTGAAALPVALHGEGQGHVLWSGSLVSPKFTGNLKATNIGLEIPEPAGSPQGSQNQARWIAWDEIDAEGSYDAAQIAILHGHLQRGSEEIALDGTVTAAASEPAQNETQLRHGLRAHGQVGINAPPGFDANSLLHAHVRATKVAVGDLLPFTGLNLPLTGTLDAQFKADGPLHSPGGSGWAELSDAILDGESISRIHAQGTLDNRVLHLSAITAQSPAGTVNASGSYDFASGRFQAAAEGSGLNLSAVKHLHPFTETVQGRLTFAATALGTRDDPHIEGHADVTGLMLQGKPLGSAQLTAHTAGGALVYDLASHTETAESSLHGQTELRGSFETQAQAQFSQFNIGAVLRMAQIESISADSALAGTATVSGPLAHPEQMRGDLRLAEAAVTVAGVHLHSGGPVHASLANSRVQLDPVHILGDQTDMQAQGTLELTGDKKLDMAASGSINLKLAETLDRDLTADGTTTFQVEAHGPVASPQLRGRVDFQDGALALEGLPNGLSHIRGTLEFNQNRLEVRSLTATTGGGQITLGGYLAYQHGLYADLTSTGKNIRLRYPPGVSSLADTSLRLQGPQNNLLLSGSVLITRFTVSPDLDIASLAAQANSVQTVAPPDAPSNRIRLDVRIQSSPQLNFQNAFAKLAGDVDLHLRGTVASPSLLGRVSITEGSANIAGTRYDLQRGEVTFNNPVRIQPSLDLNATARVEDYDITLSLHGTPDKLSVSYRSDPPLPEADVVALLAVGRTQSEQGLYTQQQQAANSTTDVLLGGALNATMSSRVQKLFGAGSVKVDPSYIGALGNSTTRITVEEQLGRYVTLTYATNVDTSAQQLLQAEIAVNRHLSVLVERDESGVFSMVVKNTRRYR